MSFAIEVPGEANPLNLQDLCRMLSASTSHDHSQRQSAGQQLTAWEAHEDYYPALQTVFLDRSLPREVRLLAIIQLKNGIDKYWRHHSAKNAIPPPGKQMIRSRLFEGTIGELDPQMALHNALVVAKVVRIDCPQEWPDALTSLISVVRTTKDGDKEQLSGALLILLRVVKELSTARLRKSQTALQAATPELVYMLGEIYTAATAAWSAFLTSGKGDEDEADLSLSNSLVSLKVLRRLLVAGYEHPHKDDTVRQVWSLSQTQFGQFLNLVSHDSPIPAPYLDIVGKHLLQFTKLHINMSDTHPASFAALPDSIDLVRAYWDLVAKFAEIFDKSGGIRQSSSAAESRSKLEGPLLERLALKGLLLVRACVRMVHYPQTTFKYRSPEMRREQDALIENFKTNLLKDELIVQMANVIISHLFVFRKSDLEAWEEDPEDWEQQEETQGSAWEWEVRPCAEKLFLDLLINYKSLLLQPLLSYFETAKNPEADLVAKEAVYTAMGLAAGNVHEDFNFDSVLQSTIVRDAQDAGSFSKVLRRRIAILLSQWVPVKVSDESRPLIYEIFRHFLNPQDQNNDLVVRITAARQFKWVAEDFKFNGEMFLPFASDVLTELIKLLQEVDVDETKLAIIETTRVIIYRMETHVSQFGDLVMAALPGIWESAGDLGFMMKQAVLTILQTLVMAMRADSQKYHGNILPLISQAVQEQSDLHLYLIDEALELWNNVLTQSTPPLAPELIGLAESAITYLEAHTEHSVQYLSIAGFYIMLAPESMLEDRFRRPLLTSMIPTFTSKSREELGIATKYVEYYIMLAQQLGGTQGLQYVAQDMLQTGFLSNLLEGIHDAFEASKTSGPNRKKPRVDALTITDYFAILSRIAVAEPTLFVELIASIGPIDQVWPWLSSEWFSSFDTIADAGRLKLLLLAMTRLLELPAPMQDLVLSKLQDYFSMWTTVMTQILEEGNPPKDSLVMKQEPEATEWDTAKDVRERALLAHDPVVRVESLEFVKEKLNELVQRVGGEQAFQENYLVNVDGDVVAGFQKLGVPSPQQ